MSALPAPEEKHLRITKVYVFAQSLSIRLETFSTGQSLHFDTLNGHEVYEKLGIRPKDLPKDHDRHIKHPQSAASHH